MNDTIKNFGYPDSLIKAYDHWVVLLRPQQLTLGSLVLAAKSDATQLHELSPEAFAELKIVTTDIENTLADVTAYQRINYLMLMMVDPHVHYHVFPRYESPLHFQEIEFADQGWPGPPNLGLVTSTDAAVNTALVAHLRANWRGTGS